MLRQPDVVAGLVGGLATIPMLALGGTVLHGPARSAFTSGADAVVAAVIGAGVIAAVRGGSAPWKGFETVEAIASVALALACACALLPPLTARFGSSRISVAMAAIAGGAIVLRGGLSLAVHTGLAVRDDPLRITGVAVGLGLVCAITAVAVVALRRARAPVQERVAPWLLVLCGVVSVSTAVALACAESALFPIQLRAPAGSSFVSTGSTSEAILQALTGVSHAVPRAQVGGIVVALVVGAGLALWQTRRRSLRSSAAA